MPIMIAIPTETIIEAAIGVIALVVLVWIFRKRMDKNRNQ